MSALHVIDVNELKNRPEKKMTEAAHLYFQKIREMSCAQGEICWKLTVKMAQPRTHAFLISNYTDLASFIW